MNTPAAPDWEKGIISQYSNIAVVNEDCVDGYEMVPAEDFIRTLLSDQRRELAGKVEGWLQSSAQLYAFPERVHYNKAIRDVLALLKDPK